MKSLKEVKLDYAKSLLVSKGNISNNFVSYSDVIAAQTLISNNQNKLSTVSRSVSGSVNGILINGGGINVSSISGAAPTSITVNRASIYGAGLFNSDFKGVRIDKKN